MKSRWKITAVTVLVGGSLWAGSLLNLTAEGAVGSGQPGTVDDPVVTKSYVDQAIRQALNGGGSNTSGSSQAAPSAPATPAAPSTNDGNGLAGDTLKIVELNPGKKLIAYAGAEFIVRSGKAVIYSADANGVADLTDGVDITNGGKVTNNHLLFFPKDGRGIQVAEDSKYNLTVIVRGGYTIE